MRTKVTTIVEMEDEREKIMEKAAKRQKWIISEEDLSDYGYVRHGHNKNGVQMWQDKKNHDKINNNTERHKERAKAYNKYGSIKKRLEKKLGIKLQLHHEWIDGTAQYNGLALVDAELHRKGIIKVILLLEGEITKEVE